jgi:MFS family permease
MVAHQSVSSEQGNRGWIVVGATFITLGMVYGVWYSFSVFLVAFLREFGWSRSLLAGVFSTFVIVHGVLGPLNGWLAGRIGPRRIILAGGGLLGVGLLLVAETNAWWHLYATLGGIVGAGVACAGWVPSIILVRSWFPDRVGTALGVASAGIGIGITGIVPLTQVLVNSLGWRWAYRILGGLAVAWIIPATLWVVREPPAVTSAPALGRVRASSSQAVYWTLATALRDWHFWGLASVFFSGNVATQMLLIHQVAYLVDHGVPALAAATVGGMVGFMSIPGKVGWGTLSDRVNREVAYTLAFACVVGSIVTLVLAGRYPTSAVLYVYAILLGLGYAATAPLTPAAASDLFSGPKFSTIFGTLHVSNALGASAGAWIGGRVFDQTGSYLPAFGLALVMAVFSASLLWIVAPRRPHPPPSRAEYPITNSQ